MPINFEWSSEKATHNLAKHHVGFSTAARVFHDPHRIEHVDGREDYGEDRYLTIGLVGPITLAVVYTLRDEGVIRIISARKATTHEQAIYWKNRPPRP